MNVDGEPLKDPNEISNILSRADVSAPYDSELTEMVLEWGQFITNDITAVPETGMYCVHVYYSNIYSFYRAQCTGTTPLVLHTF